MLLRAIILYTTIKLERKWVEFESSMFYFIEYRFSHALAIFYFILFFKRLYVCRRTHHTEVFLGQFSRKCPRSIRPRYHDVNLAPNSEDCLTDFLAFVFKCQLGLLLIF